MYQNLILMIMYFIGSQFPLGYMFQEKRVNPKYKTAMLENIRVWLYFYHYGHYCINIMIIELHSKWHSPSQFSHWYNIFNVRICRV